MDGVLSIFSFKGRLRRRWFVVITLPVVVLNLLLSFANTGGSGGPEAASLLLLLCLVTLWPYMAAAWKRNHDQGRSGWWSLLLFVPLVGLIHYILLAVGAGEYGRTIPRSESAT